MANEPVYRKMYGTQWFKIIPDSESVLNIRDDEAVSGLGVCGITMKDSVDLFLAFEESTKEEFNAALARVMDKIEPFLIDIMYTRDK